MGILADLKSGIQTLGGLPPVVAASPLSPRPNHLSHFVLSDLFGTDSPRLMTREDAMRIPALARCRTLICSTIARLPLEAIKEGEPLENQPAWINRSSGQVSPFHRMLWTADDLLFYGWSLWWVERGAENQILSADRVPMERWSLESSGEIRIDDKPVPARNAVLIPGIHDGILSHGDDAIRHYRDLLHAAAKAASTPMAMVELHQTGERPLTDEQVQNLVSDFANARRGRNGGIAFTSGVQAKELGAAKEHLLTEGRNAAAIDVARLCGIPSTMIDAVISGSSLSYSNPDSRMAELITFGIAPYMTAISARLGLDDIVPRGVGMQFDTAYSLAPITEVAAPDDGLSSSTAPARKSIAEVEEITEGITSNG